MLTSLPAVGSVAILSLGLVLGLRHATEVDHVVAVSTIVSEHRSVWHSLLVGALWGTGHTLTLIIVGMLVVVFKVAIPVTVAAWAELGVAVMIIGLGVLAITRTFRIRPDVHLHSHSHDGQLHMHIHCHETGKRKSHRLGSHSHTVVGMGLKPFFVGSIHGLAGSAGLTMLILTQMESIWMSIWYLLVFGLGSICGMILVSGLIGVPFALSSNRLTRIHVALHTIAGSLSVVFGLWYALQVSTR